MPPKFHGHGGHGMVGHGHGGHGGHGPVVVVQQQRPVVVVQQQHHGHGGHHVVHQQRPVVVVQQQPQVVYQQQPQVVYQQQPQVVVVQQGQQQGLPFAKLHAGRIVSLQSKASGQNLRVQNGEVNGQGGNGALAKFRVHRQGHFVRFEHVQSASYLRSRPDGGLDSSNGPGPNTKFQIHPINPPVFAFESVANTGFVGILPNGQPKNAQQTGQGKNGRFEVISW